MPENIRNFAIIAHIDHGKSTLADRFLELTHTVEARKMHAQYLDQMPLERERGITIKMQPVRMEYRMASTNNEYITNERIKKEFVNSQPDSLFADKYILNLIDTPGHIDFSYEVSRALAAVEGAILLVDATQGVEAQTLTNIELARALNLTIIPAINKIDLPQARIEEVEAEMQNLLGVGREEILRVSGKTGEGVERLLKEVVRKIPPPRFALRSLGEDGQSDPRALVFDFEYSLHRGVIAHVRMTDGKIEKGARLKFSASGQQFIVGECGVFTPALSPASALEAGEIGYIVTNIKEAKVVRAGDTVLKEDSSLPPLPGYKETRPVVFSSLYPERQDDFDDLRRALERLKLSDSSFSFEEESAGVLGRGFRAGFLGMLHLEIIVERLRRDFNLETIVATPTVRYKVKTKKEEYEIYSPSKFPDEGELLEVWEPWIKAEFLMPPDKLSSVLKLLQEHDAVVGETHKFSETRIKLETEMPLRELMRDFFDNLKSVSQGYASISYEFLEMRKGDLARLDVLVAGETEPAFCRVVPKSRVETEAGKVTEKLYKILPRALFTLKIQARARGRIIASSTLKALRKDVTGHLYGGDRTRKMKLWKKQREGKKRLEAEGKFTIPPGVFIEMIKKG